MWMNPTYNVLADRDQWQAIAKRLPVRKEHVLDLGCGSGRLAQRLSACFSAYTGVDIEGMIGQARQLYPSLGDRFVVSTVNSYQFPAEGFDMVLSISCIASACTAAELPAILDKIARSLASGGRFIMIDPLHRHPLLSRYLRLSPEQVVKLAERSGLVLDEQRSIHCWPFRLILTRAACARYPRLTAVCYRIGEIVLKIASMSLGDYALLVFRKADAYTP
jgi:SAM-dependent methyltransferase